MINSQKFSNAFSEIWELTKFSRYYHPQMKTELQTSGKIMHHCEQSYHLLMKSNYNVP